MASTIDQIKDEIVDILALVVETGGSTQVIKATYRYPESAPSGYPYAVVDYLGDESVQLTNKEDLVTYDFSIRIVQEKIEALKGRANAEATAEAVAYSVNEKFRDWNKLGLSDVLRILPVETKKSYVDGNTRIQLDIKIQAQTVENITSA